MTFVQEENENDKGNNYRSCGKRSVQHNKRFSEEKKMRLIDADKLREDVLSWENCYNGYSDAYDKSRIIGAIEEMPTVDAEPVIRCKDCKYWEVDNDVGFCTRTEDCDWNADDFCSRGEKR